MIDLPIDFQNRMRETLKEEYPAFIESFSRPPLSGFRANTLKIAPNELCRIFPFAKASVSWCPEGFIYDGGFGNHPFHRAGLFYSQEPSAMLPAELLDVKECDKVLDLCAAPGGKSTQISAKLNGTGLLVSNEIVRSRSLILRENIERMGIGNCVVTNISPEKMEEEFPAFFDKILVDAPCSGEGMFRKNDEAILAWSVEHTISCAERQRLILDSAAKMLSENGVIVYSTCTFSEEENQKTVEYFLAHHAEFKCEEMRTVYPHKATGEGQFAARLIKSGGEKRGRNPLVKQADNTAFRAFERENLNTNLQGNFIAFADNLYLLPPSFGDISSIKLTLPGLHLGCVKKNRFEPSHHLCLYLKQEDFKRTYSLSENESEQYFSGNVIYSGAADGWGAMLFASYPVGWYKASGGAMKNHYPKQLRKKF